MVKQKIAMLIATSLFSAVAAHAGPLKCKSAEDAGNYIQFNLPDKANACFDRLISQNPTDAKLHFLKGKFCLSQGDLQCAKERFSVAVVKKKYAGKIAGFYERMATAKLRAGDSLRAEQFYHEAFIYNPGLAKELANKLFEKGKQDSAKELRSALLDMAGKLNSVLNPAISAFYYSLSQTASTGEEKVDLLAKAVQFDSARYSDEYEEKKRTLGNVHLEEAKKLSRKVGGEKKTEAHRALAVKYLGESVVQADLPVELVYQPGEYSFQLQANEQTPHWISFPEGALVNYTLSSSEPNCTLLYADGASAAVESKITIGPATHKASDTFKIVALTDQTEITMVVKASPKRNSSTWGGNNVVPLWERSLGKFCFLGDGCGSN